MRITTIDKAMNALDDARESACLSQAELARHLHGMRTQSMIPA